MTTISTDMRNTIESARRIRYEPTVPITATDVQTAIEQAISIPTTTTTTNVNAAMSPYAVVGLDQVLLVDTSGGPITITMLAQAGRNGLPLEIKDVTGDAAANPITVDMVPGETADGLDPFPIDSGYGRALFTPQTGGYWVK